MELICQSFPQGLVYIIALVYRFCLCSIFKWRNSTHRGLIWWIVCLWTFSWWNTLNSWISAVLRSYGDLVLYLIDVIETDFEFPRQLATRELFYFLITYIAGSSWGLYGSIRGPINPRLRWAHRFHVLLMNFRCNIWDDPLPVIISIMLDGSVDTRDVFSHHSLWWHLKLSVPDVFAVYWKVLLQMELSLIVIYGAEDPSVLGLHRGVDALKLLNLFSRFRETLIWSWISWMVRIGLRNARHQY